MACFIGSPKRLGDLNQTALANTQRNKKGTAIAVPCALNTKVSAGRRPTTDMPSQSCLVLRLHSAILFSCNWRSWSLCQFERLSSRPPFCVAIPMPNSCTGHWKHRYQMGRRIQVHVALARLIHWNAEIGCSGATPSGADNGTLLPSKGF